MQSSRAGMRARAHLFHREAVFLESLHAMGGCGDRQAINWHSIPGRLEGAGTFGSAFAIKALSATILPAWNFRRASDGRITARGGNRSIDPFFWCDFHGIQTK
jgi:hypothetical protein